MKEHMMFMGWWKIQHSKNVSFLQIWYILSKLQQGYFVNIEKIILK